MTNLLRSVRRRLRRRRRQRLVGRAYDMALEVARVIPPAARVLDIGCGNGFIAHHLTAMLGGNVVGLDLAKGADAPIEYLRYDGMRFPVLDRSFDVVLLCYVLHHAQDYRVVLGEVRRVLRDGGLAVVYEDIPATCGIVSSAGLTICGGGAAPDVVSSDTSRSGARCSVHSASRSLRSAPSRAGAISPIPCAAGSTCSSRTTRRSLK